MDNKLNTTDIVSIKEKIEDWQEAQEAEKIIELNNPAIPHDEVMKRYGKI